MKPKLTFIAIFLYLGSFGQQILADRPAQTVAATTIPKGSLQIEMGLAVQTLEYNSINAFAGPSTLLKYGIMNGLELRIFNQYLSYKFDNFYEDYKVNGFSDLELGVKVQLFKKEGITTEVAFLSHAIIPTAKDDLSNQEVGSINKLSIAHKLNDKIGLGYNIGYDYVNQIHNFTYSAIIGFTLGKNFGAYLEPYGRYAEQGFFESFFDAGVTYLSSDNFQLDASYGVGINNDMQFFSAGFSWNIPHIFGSY